MFEYNHNHYIEFWQARVVWISRCLIHIGVCRGNTFYYCTRRVRKGIWIRATPHFTWTRNRREEVGSEDEDLTWHKRISESLPWSFTCCWIQKKPLPLDVGLYFLTVLPSVLLNYSATPHTYQCGPLPTLNWDVSVSSSQIYKSFIEYEKWGLGGRGEDWGRDQWYGSACVDWVSILCVCTLMCVCVRVCICMCALGVLQCYWTSEWVMMSSETRQLPAALVY